MGIKRPLDEENFSEHSFKQSKQHDHIKKLTLNAEESQLTSSEVDSADGAKSNICKLPFDEHLDEGDTASESTADKEYKASIPLSVVTSCNTKEDKRNGDTSFWSYLPGYVDLSLARRPPEEFEDPYTYLLNCPSRKEVPVGPDYQAEVPHSDSNTGSKDFSGSNYFSDNKSGQDLMGACIIPFPVLEDSTNDGIRLGCGRTDCSCLDVGSMRCVQQHVKEAREKLRESIGEDYFSELGFYDMGDEVARKWTPVDEQLFHDVVITNPLSQGRNFWRHLTAAFPTRTKKELVSYYFNVFMLHRRAVQNRSYLEIDSDDDEEHHGNGATTGDSFQNGSCSVDPDTDNDDALLGPEGKWYLLGGEKEDSTVDSFDDQDLDANWMDDFWPEPESVGGDGRSNQSHGGCNGNVEKQDTDGMDGRSRTEEMCGQETENLEDDNLNFDS